MTDMILSKEQRPWWRDRRKLRRLVLLIAAFVLAAGVAWGITELRGSCELFRSGVDKVDGTCVGVTDGSYVFRPELESIYLKIKRENARVRERSAPYVTVALLDPLTPASATVLPDGAIRHRLEGAYSALRRVNTSTVVGDTKPQIELVLASEGSTDAQWRHVLDELVQRSKREEHPLVAVIGLGVSTKQTQQRAEELSNEGIPMVSAYLIADMLDYEHIPGLIRMSPSNRYYVDALRGYLDTTELESGVMLRDSNSENGVDLFTQTLAKNFERQMGDLLDFPTLEYTGTGVLTDGVEPRLFANVRANICAADGLQAVFFAGREIDLNPFLDSLENRPCPDTPLTILTGGLDLGEVLDGREQELRNAKLTVVVASTVNAEGWQDEVEKPPESYDDFRSVFVDEQGFDSGHLDGANAIMMHDAMLAAAQAIRLASPEGGISSPTAAGVLAQLLNLHGLFEVRGASGTVHFSSDAPKGYPIGKPIPVLQYPQPVDSSSRQVGPPYSLEN